MGFKAKCIEKIRFDAVEAYLVRDKMEAYVVQIGQFMGKLTEEEIGDPVELAR